MELREVPRITWVLVAIALLIAMMRLPYGYYTFNRFLTCGFCILIAILNCQDDGVPGKIWTGVFVLVAIVFNPLVPLHLSRFTWPYLDLGAAVAVVAHLLFVRQKLT
jgi:hypothetical protein